MNEKKKTVQGNQDEKEKSRQLTPAEQRRLRAFEALSETMVGQGWRRTELTVGIVKANVFAVVLLIPLLTVLVFRLTGLPQTMRMAVLISASAPVGVNVAVYAQLHDLDYAYASETVVLSTLLSVLFQPLVLMLAAGF